MVNGSRPFLRKRSRIRSLKTGQDKYVKKLITPAYLKLFLHAQLQKRDSLRDIADDVVCQPFQRELGLSSISAAQLCRKHSQVNPDLLQQVIERLARFVLGPLMQGADAYLFVQRYLAALRNLE
ncbi:DUF4372 domain-containing protein [Paenibacillus solisilvae]|uniref:DUF4372 domain-containing protein n=1 Tax=Paenibacillus solisilvae TaxID=2486751 RepID=A0ABW0VZZ4_9BACL